MLVDRRIPPQRYFPSVQGLRGVSALSVFTVHIYEMAKHGGFFPDITPALEAALSCFGNGVALFFIISGFVIPASLFRHGNVRLFLSDRLLRIMPVFLVIHIAVFVIGPFIGYKWMRGIGVIDYVALFITNMTFTALPFGLQLAQQNSWTLTYEWGFYLFIVVCWMALSSIKLKWLARMMIVFAATAACLAFPICLYFLVGMGFAFLRPQVRLPRTCEWLVIPACLLAFFYCTQFLSYALAVPISVILFLAVLQDGSLTSRCLCSPVLQYVGKISYSLYLIHTFAMFPFQLIGQHLVARHVNTSILFVAFVVLGISTSFALSATSYAWLEVRLRGRLANWIGAPKTRRVATA